MKIFSAAQFREWDQYTILHEPIASVDLMERAARDVTNWIGLRYPEQKKITVFCGCGNNGGDGLAIARMLIENGRGVDIYILPHESLSPDCQINYRRLLDKNREVFELSSAIGFPVLVPGQIIIEALFGTGLNKPLEGIAKQLAEHLNQSGATVLSMPAGLYADDSSGGNTLIHAAHTISFQGYKLAFMFAENEACTGQITILDIGLHARYYEETITHHHTMDEAMAKSIFRPRKKFTNKYTYGHALLYAGSQAMMGAAILCAEACLRSGTGLVTVSADTALMPVIQTALPEVICSAETNLSIITKKKNSIGIGPGLELNEKNSNLLNQLLSAWDGPLVIDASALGLLPIDTGMLHLRKNNPVILTPHTGEFERLFGKSINDFTRMEKACQKARELNCFIILKGFHTLVACPDGMVYFNTTGNSGMATAGSGDVLTGMLTGLLAQGYGHLDACLLGVFLHGMAGDLAAKARTEETMIAGDIIDMLGDAYRNIYPGTAE
jgi:NAD(P)H-hydrate epimerase